MSEPEVVPTVADRAAAERLSKILRDAPLTGYPDDADQQEWKRLYIEGGRWNDGFTHADVQFISLAIATARQEASKDTARLDWLYSLNQGTYHDVPSREAIDKAMEAES